MSDKNFEPLKKAFLKQSWLWEESEELFESIDVKNKENMWLYNYRDKILVSRTHPVLVKCRGMVVSTEGQILNYPFDRFFNDWEKECAAIDWDSAEIQEKLDGSLVCVFWSGKDWEITTRGSFYPYENAEIDYAEEFKRLFDGWSSLNKNTCYMFELISKKNRIVTWYDEEKVYLLGARDLKTNLEFDKFIDWELVMKLWVNVPKKFSATNFEECKKLYSNLKHDEEGFVVVDKNFNRAKVKQESYLKLSKIINLKEQDLFEYVLGKTELDIEYLEKLPEVRKEIELIKIFWGNAKEKVIDTFNEIKKLPSRKEFAEQAKKYNYKGALFHLLDGGKLEDLWHLQIEDVREWL